MDRFYDITLLHRMQLVPPILGSIEAWRALDVGGRRITLVRPRPDIIAAHLAGSSSSNVAAFEADLRTTRTKATTTAEDELALVELRHVENGRLPVGIFEPLDGWPVRDLARFVRCNVELAAAITLAMYRSYSGGANVLTPDGNLVHRFLPNFAEVWNSEMPSFTGLEPDVSIRGRIGEARALLARLADHHTSDAQDAESNASARAFVTELEALAHPDAGPALARLLRESYRFVSPWEPTA